MTRRTCPEKTRWVPLAIVAILPMAVLSSAPSLAGATPGPCTDAPTRQCALPFPNDQVQTRRDSSTPTHRRVDLMRSALPANRNGVQMDPTDENRQDGFSPGQPILIRIPGLDTQAAFDRSRIVPVNDLAQYKRPGQPVLLLDAGTGHRWPVYGELDATATIDSQRLLILRPGRNLIDGHTYVVVLRGLRTASGRLIPRPPGWARVLRGHGAAYAQVRAALKRARIAPGSLYAAWSFTVASTRSLTGRMLHIRDNAFAHLGDHNLADSVITGRAPKYAITAVSNYTAAENAQIARKVRGTVTVPCYLNAPGCPAGASFHYASASPGALPDQLPGNVITAPFECNIPRSASPSAPARISLYGHGLLGDTSEIDAGNVRDMSIEHNFVFCATPEIGMAAGDVPNAIKILGDLSRFPSLADRLQQGLLDELFLGRLLDHPHGLVADRAFRLGGAPLIDRAHLYYDSNSQGAILGGALTAISPDFTRAVLGVAGMDFSALLPRSTDFDTYSKIFYPAYPRESDRPLALAVIQTLWDRGESDGYANHMSTAHLPDTPPHTVLIQVGVGDQQVSNWTAEVEARTLGARTHEPGFGPGRTLERRPLFGIPALPASPFSGSAIVFWDNGRVTLPAQVPASATHTGRDPHEDVRATPAARLQKSDFLLPRGAVVNTCGPAPCHTAVFNAMP